LVESLQEAARLGDGLFDVAEDVLGGIEPRILRKESGADSVGRPRLAGEILVLARHDPQERRLPGAVQTEDADLRARQERQPDSAQDLALRRNDLPQVLHREDVLVRHGSRGVYTGASPMLIPIVPRRRFSQRTLTKPARVIRSATPL